MLTHSFIQAFGWLIVFASRPFGRIANTVTNRGKFLLQIKGAVTKIHLLQQLQSHTNIHILR